MLFYGRRGWSRSRLLQPPLPVVTLLTFTAATSPRAGRGEVRVDASMVRNLGRGSTPSQLLSSSPPQRALRAGSLPSPLPASVPGVSKCLPVLRSRLTQTGSKSSRHSKCSCLGGPDWKFPGSRPHWGELGSRGRTGGEPGAKLETPLGRAWAEKAGEIEGQSEGNRGAIGGKSRAIGDKIVQSGFWHCAVICVFITRPAQGQSPEFPLYIN